MQASKGERLTEEEIVDVVMEGPVSLSLELNRNWRNRTV
jgi:hypothetical protein